MAKSRIKYVIAMDTETGGLPNKNKLAFVDVALTEIAFVVIDMESLQIVDEISWLIQPNYLENLEYNEQAQKVSGITLELLTEKGILLKQVYKEVKDFLLKYSKGSMPVLTGHNIIKFDSPFLQNLFIHFDDSGLTG